MMMMRPPGDDDDGEDDDDNSRAAGCICFPVLVSITTSSNPVLRVLVLHIWQRKETTQRHNLRDC